MTAVALTLALPLSGAFSADVPDAAPAPRPALTVSVAQPARVQMLQRLVANGDIAAWQEASVGTAIGEQRLVEVRADVGDAVRAGQVLAVFDDGMPRAEAGQARAALLEAEAAAVEAVANAKRARTLRETGAMSEQQVIQFLTAEKTALARIASAKATLAARELRLRHTRVLALDDGVISARSATVGAVAANGAELFRMIRQGRLEWRARLTEAEIGRVHVGQTVALTLADGSRLTGRLRMVAPTVDPQTRFGLVYVDLPVSGAEAGLAKAGMFARGEFELGEVEALTVPQQAVVVREAFSYVFSVGGDGRVAQLKVGTGRRAGDRVEIVEGLSEDAQVVVAGAGFLNDGDLVRIAEAVPAR
ncbi:membrane fusion protein [Thauera linaloolentis 47Lol = DSM 12138]|uniref:Membrane fusion protein n=1 Tax=Thauera linaloolentis (strain DSM 12138 / JCM 21573 / CCUG 41526 / CIP 105981 / IAM 15112 / NBRC 102519 / 47Lol) TaxID=1123367 RepID=N6YCF4_THAL4|nr:membrane fusion protein [Thauera linaloolentis 47Lol = DSM 12138]